MYVWNTSSDGTRGSILRSKGRNTLKFNLENGPLPSVDDHPKEKSLQRKVDNMFEEFGSSTTLPGVSHVLKRPKLLWKLFWLVVSLSATSMAIYQSWPILKDFIDGKTVQSTSYSPDFDFPSVTFCSNVRLHHVRRSIYFNGVDQSIDPDNQTSLISFVEFVHRRELVVNITPFEKKFAPRTCNYNRKHCDINDDEDLHYFKTALYGNCVTFNVGTKNRKIGRPNSNLNLKFSMDKYSRQLEFNENYILFWLHPPSSAPVLYRSEGSRVYPGDSVEIRFAMKHIRRLPRRDNECLDPYTDKQRLASFYYTNHTKYIYTTRACVYTLLFETKLKEYRCLDPAVPRNEMWESLWRSDQYNICYAGNNMPPPGSNGDDSNETDISTLFNFDANCSLPCSEWMLDFTTTSTSAWFEAMVADSLRNKTSRKPRDLKWDSRYAEVKIGLGATMVEMVDEDYRYKPGDFAGIIGGNVGIWVGLCAISLAEVLELVIRLLVVAWKRLFAGPHSTPHHTRIIQIKMPHK